ncbi:unnamed protein product, partial [Meganyctiphanes norvegica]
VLYIQYTLKLPMASAASVPFVMYAAGFVGTLPLPFINTKIGENATFTLGCLLGFSGCVWVGFDQSEEYKEWGIYIVASLLMIAGSTLIITSVSFIADMI